MNRRQENPVTEHTLSIDGIHLPRFLYGTAWKEEETQKLTELALQQGFRGIDTANQRRHYHEAAVGQAIASIVRSAPPSPLGGEGPGVRGPTSVEGQRVAAASAGEGPGMRSLTRDDLFLQTKFTSRQGQDHRLPYDPDAPVPIQVEQSFASSLTHLGVTRLDSYVLHGPTQRRGLASADWDAWRAMEAIHVSGRVRLLGISNVSLEQLQLLCQRARVPPRFVQNRCYAVTGWDRQIREFCASNGLIYQGFSLLTANRELLLRPELIQIAKRHGRTVSQIIFRFALDVGMIPLTGTTNPAHMKADLEVFDFCLEPEEIERIERLAA
jgi:diketogulonate reductase-like aldo/keto reductase